KKKKRTLSSPGDSADDAAAPAVTPEQEVASGLPGGLSTDEMDARRRALEIARVRAEADARDAALLEAQRAREEAAAPPPPSPPPAVAPATGLYRGGGCRSAGRARPRRSQETAPAPRAGCCRAVSGQTEDGGTAHRAGQQAQARHRTWRWRRRGARQEEGR